MGSVVTNRRGLGFLAVALTVVVAASTRGRAQGHDSPITLDARCQGSQVTLTIRNVGSQDTAVIFGVVLGNGIKYLVSELTLRANGSDGSSNQYVYWPADYPNLIGGRLDDWIVPLPAGVAYVMPVTPSQFRVRSMGQRLSAWPTPARLSFTLALRTPNPTPSSDVVGLKLFKVWRGAEALTSNEVAVPGQCD
jgi:hypothetical protein